MKELIHHLDFHSIEGANTEKRQFAVRLLLVRAERLKLQIDSLKNKGTKKALALVDELEAVIEQAERIVADENIMVDRLEQIIAGAKPELSDQHFLPAAIEVDLEKFKALVGQPIINKGHIYFLAGSRDWDFLNVYNEAGQQVMADIPPPASALTIVNQEVYGLGDFGADRFVFDLNGKIYKPNSDYEDLASPIELAGKLYYPAKIFGQWCLIDQSGNVVNDFSSTSDFDGKNYATVINGKIFLRVDSGFGSGSKIIGSTVGPAMESKDQSPAFDQVRSPVNIDERLVFVGKKKDGLWYWSDPWVGKESAEGYADLGNPVKIDDKIYYRALHSDSVKTGWSILWNDIDLTRSYEALQDPIVAKNTLFYPAKRNGEWVIAFPFSQERVASGEHEYISHFKAWGPDNFVFAGQQGGLWRIYDCNGIMSPHILQEIYDIHIENNKVRLLGKRNNKYVSFLLP